ncbi:MAG: zinc-dependent dehydrogenase [Candidatus Aenigmarchaeota archaeon]|nr:zinc-dependent dehydrogenase [Candidatus Aenigmarchaeota archaeon]
MKVAMYYSNSDVRLEEMKKPKAGKGEILLKVMASGICGSDIMEWYRIKKAPLVLGHEVAGDIAEVGEGVTGFRVGDRVTVTHHVPCGDCNYCRDDNSTMCETLRTTKFYPGGFSEYLRVPGINVKKGTLILPKSVSYNEGTFVEPLGCVIRGQRKAQVKKNHNVLVLGSGLSGLLHIKLAKAIGCRNVIATDVSADRRKAALKSGADSVIDANENVPEKLMELNNGRLADRVIVCTGAAQAFGQALESVDRGGTVLFFASMKPDERLPVPVEHLWKNGISIVTTYAADMKDLQDALRLIEEKTVTVGDMVTHELPLEKIGEGFRLFASGKSIKVIIKPYQ